MHMLQISKRAGYLCFLMKDFYTSCQRYKRCTQNIFGKNGIKEVWPVDGGRWEKANMVLRFFTQTIVYNIVQ